MTKAADVKRMVETAVKAFGRLDVLVNNAGGIPERGPVLGMSEAGFTKTLEANLTSAFLCSREALPELFKTKGNIVNIASLAGLRGAPNNTAYGAAKGGMVILTKDMALDYAARGVRVNAVCPAYVETDLNREMLANLKKTGEYDALVKMHPLGRLGRPLEALEPALLVVVRDGLLQFRERLVAAHRALRQLFPAAEQGLQSG